MLHKQMATQNEGYVADQQEKDQKQKQTMSEQTTFQNGFGGCCAEPGGAGNCLLSLLCPCYSYYKAAEDIGDDNGVLYCVGTLCGCGCCVLTDLGMKVAKKQGIEQGCGKSGMCSIVDVCSCYSCAVTNEAMLYKAAANSAEPVADKMEDRA